MMSKHCYGLVALALWFWSPAAHAQVEPATTSLNTSFHADQWHVSVSPYLWLAGLDGNLDVLGHQAAVQQSFGDILGNLKFGVMGLTEVRRGRIALLTDLLFVRIGDQKAVPVPQFPSALPVTVTSNTFTLTSEIGYRVYANDRFSADLLAGVRYYHISANLDADAGPIGQASYSRSDNWADAVGGARLQLRLTQRVGLFLIGDAGGGGSSPTWQLATGAGYRLTKRSTAQFGYRRLYFNRQTGPNFAFDATQEGFILGSTLRFR
jgi:opacity protein-like surface antigen